MPRISSKPNKDEPPNPPEEAKEERTTESLDQETKTQGAKEEKPSEAEVTRDDLPDNKPKEPGTRKLKKTQMSMADPAPTSVADETVRPAKTVPTAYSPEAAAYQYNGRRVQVVCRYSEYVQIRDAGVVLMVNPSQVFEIVGSDLLDGEVNSLNVNTCLADDLVANPYLGIRSNTVAKQIVRNRQGGYKDFEQFKQLNSHLSSLNWPVLKSHLVF